MEGDNTSRTYFIAAMLRRVEEGHDGCVREPVHVRRRLRMNGRALRVMLSHIANTFVT